MNTNPTTLTKNVKNIETQGSINGSKAVYTGPVGYVPSQTAAASTAGTALKSAFSARRTGNTSALWNVPANTAASAASPASSANGISGVPVRSYMQSAGLDPGGIGWDGQNVTYNGKTFTPRANVNGVTYADKNDLDKFIGDILTSQGLAGIRASAKNYGLDESKLRYANGVVSYNGAAINPALNANGTTYAYPDAIRAWARDALRTQGDDLVQVNRYTSDQGLYDVYWNDAEKKLYVGGSEVPYSYIDDAGNAHARKSDLQNAYDILAKRMGITGLSEIDRKNQERFDRVERDIEAMKNREFSYDPENDAAYRAYRDMYRREASRAYEDTIARETARTGGQMSSMARSQAQQAYDRYISRMTDMIPSLVQAAYERYAGDRNASINLLGTQMDILGRRIQEENDLRAKALEAYASGRNERAARYSDPIAAMQYRQAISDNDLAIKKNTYEGASLVNRAFTKEEADILGIQPDSSGEYPTPAQIQQSIEKEMWENVQRGILEEQTAIQLSSDIRKATEQYNMDMRLAEYKNEMSKSLAAYKNELSKNLASYKQSISAKSKSSTGSAKSTSSTSQSEGQQKKVSVYLTEED